jgi:hypothetical protein
LEDLREDLEMMIEECKGNYEKEAITEHVFMANLTVFKNELLGVDEFFKIVDETEPDTFENLDAMVEHLRERFKQKIDTYGLAEAVNVCIDRKLGKVAKYVLQK